MRKDSCCTREHKERVRAAAFIHAARLTNNVSVLGTVYPNATQASAATSISARTILRRCDSTDPKHSTYFRIVPKVKQ
jgi:hypothetical protein